MLTILTIFAPMEIFYSYDCDGRVCRLDGEEAAHCIKVLRHRCGESINVIDGNGTMFRCTLISDSPKGCEAQVEESFAGWGSHDYVLELAVCPTKNNDRYEWFVEKATEVGVDAIAPVIGDHSERKVYKTERAKKIALSATKQSLKAKIPQISEPVSVKDYIASAPEDALKMIAYCFEDEQHPRRSIRQVLEQNAEKARHSVVLIGPEGDFSQEEARLALEAGFIPVHLGNSRLRTETAAVTAAEALYFHNL